MTRDVLVTGQNTYYVTSIRGHAANGDDAQTGVLFRFTETQACISFADSCMLLCL